MAIRRRHTPDQIIRKIAERNKLLAGGTGLDEVCRHLQIAESTWHRWLAQYGGVSRRDTYLWSEDRSLNLGWPPQSPNSNDAAKLVQVTIAQKGISR